MDLDEKLLYHCILTASSNLVNFNLEGLPIMKLAIRIVALSVVVAGLAAAGFSPKATTALSSHLSATSSLPVPQCGPYICPAK